MKLRLRLATYKVRTNQIDIPISLLQIKTAMSKSPKLPTLPRTNMSQRRTLLPSATVSKIPNIYLKRLPVNKNNRLNIDVSSSPPPLLYRAAPSDLALSHKESDNSTREPLVTPLLPRQRQGLLKPPNLGSPIWDEKMSPSADLTSSVVKGQAADGLLSLMRQRN